MMKRAHKPLVIESMIGINAHLCSPEEDMLKHFTG